MTILSTIRDHSLPGLPIDETTELRECLDEINRVLTLPFWLEDHTGRMPTDAELMSFRFVGDVLRWAGEGIA